MGQFLEGPVAVTGATGHVGRHLLERLASLPNEVRTPGRGDDLAEAFAGADLVVHLAGTLRPAQASSFEEANVETVRNTVEALVRTKPRRAVYVSYVGADPAADNEYLRSKGRAEWTFLRGGNEVIVLRSTYVLGTPDDPGPTAKEFLLNGEKRLDVLGDGSQRVAPVFVGDLAEAIVRAGLDPDVPRGHLELGGPEVMTIEELIETVNGHPIPERHLRPFVAHLASHVRKDLPEALVDVLLHDSLPSAPFAAEVLGLELHSIREVWARVAAAA